MPLLRHSLYSQNVSLYLAPTADARDTWLPLLRTIAIEGRCFVLSSNQCIRKANLPDWIDGEKAGQNGVSAGPKPPQIRRDISSAPSDSGKPAGKLGHRRDKSRRKSVFTIDGHEICLPIRDDTQQSEEVFEESGSPSQTPGSAEKKKRRQSVFTEDGNEICLSSDGDTKSQLAPESQSSVNIGDPVNPYQALNNGHGKRRKSIFTDDGHEICLPPLREESTKPDVKVESQLSNGSGKAMLSDFACRGGSCIVSPLGEVLSGPSWEKEEDLLVVDVDFDDCLRGRLDMDVAGSYSRNDAFKLTVEGLDLSPPV